MKSRLVCRLVWNTEERSESETDICGNRPVAFLSEEESDSEIRIIAAMVIFYNNWRQNEGFTGDGLLLETNLKVLFPPDAVIFYYKASPHLLCVLVAVVICCTWKLEKNRLRKIFLLETRKKKNVLCDYIGCNAEKMYIIQNLPHEPLKYRSFILFLLLFIGSLTLFVPADQRLSYLILFYFRIYSIEHPLPLKPWTLLWLRSSSWHDCNSVMKFLLYLS